MLYEDLADGRALPGRDDVDDRVEDLRVVENVDGLAVERESGENLLDDEESLRFHRGHRGVRDDVEGGVEDGARLLWEKPVSRRMEW